MTASYTCTDCAIRWVESDGATCPGCARRGAVHPAPAVAPGVYDCTCSQRNPPGLYCPGCTRLLLDRVSTATCRLLDEIDRAQRSGRTLVGFPTELLAAVEDVRAALGGDR